MKVNNIFLVIFQFGKVVCTACKREFDLNRIKYHLSNSKACFMKYPREALNALLLKNEERKAFFHKNSQEDINVAKTFAQKQKAQDAANAARAKTVAWWKKDQEERTRKSNLSSMKQLKRKIEEIELKDLSEDITHKLANLKSEINALYEEIEKNIDAAAMTAKDYQDINSIADAYYTIVGDGNKKRMWNSVIQSKYYEIHDKLKNVLKENAHNINQPQSL